MIEKNYLKKLGRYTKKQKLNLNFLMRVRITIILINIIKDLKFKNTNYILI